MKDLDTLEDLQRFNCWVALKGKDLRTVSPDEWRALYNSWLVATAITPVKPCE